MRLDVYMTENALAPSRTRAREWIENGLVLVNGKCVTKPAFPIAENTTPDILVTGRLHPYVGRGGIKLNYALETFGVLPTGMTCADIGASTGGFTDCLLQHGAARVFAIDSGSGQLDPSLRADERVVNLEHCNARYLTLEMLGAPCGLVVADLSFISQTCVLSGVVSILEDGGTYIGLIKPQFECGPGATDRHGLIRSTELHASAIRRVRDAASTAGLSMLRVAVSPITGGDGNREFLCCCRRNAGGASVSDSMIEDVVRT